MLEPREVVANGEIFYVFEGGYHPLQGELLDLK
ncbi:MAG: hypothetical protein GX093_01985 [Xanthomonadaceae bacterium]|nr:hypothetical protein [Xanthomonadaceae bacterium]